MVLWGTSQLELVAVTGGEPEEEKLGGLACEEGFHGDSGNAEGLTLGPPG